MTGAAVALLQAVSCLGYGGFILRTFGIRPTLARAEYAAWSFGLGFGVIGWLMFWLGFTGLFQTAGYLAVLAVGLALALPDLRGGINLLRALRAFRPQAWEAACLAGIGLAGLLSLVGALAPPTDADSLAYHFYLPKYFDFLGRLEFVPRAVDGAVPLLPQMTSIPVYGLGGETGLTLWACVSGWATAFLLYATSRRFLPNAWALALVLLLVTVPAYVYGASGGQVEVRLASFVVIAAFSLQAAMRTRLARHAALCGLAVGFFMASKYTGLLFAFACGFVMLGHRQWLRNASVLTLVSCAVGFQWYAWNAVHTGDPVFPMLFERLAGHVDYRFWNAEQNRLLANGYLSIEKVLSLSIWNFLAYPFIVTFSNIEGLESSKTGLGPMIFVMLPFALVGLWAGRRKLRGHPLTVIAILLVVFSAVWFFAGSPQRVRHLLPVYPLVLIVLGYAAYRGVAHITAEAVLVFGGLSVLAIQFAGMILYYSASVDYVLGRSDRERFLTQSISGYPAVHWLNTRLRPTDFIYIEQREIAYLLAVPSYLGHPQTQVLVNEAKTRDNPAALYRQLAKLGITHLLLPQPRFAARLGFGKLAALGCVEILKEFRLTGVSSRTLAAHAMEAPPPLDITAARLRSGGCPG